MSRWGELIPHSEDDPSCLCGCLDEPKPEPRSTPEPCSDGMGRIYPFPHWHPHNGAGVCVRCGQAVDPNEQPVAHGYAAPETEGHTPMSKPDSSPVQHRVSYERGFLAQAPVDGWCEGVPAPNARASCTCGQLDTGPVGPDEAWRAAQEHVKRELPGADWGPDVSSDGDPSVQCWHYEPGTPCDWDVCRQPERLAAGDRGTDPARGSKERA